MTNIFLNESTASRRCVPIWCVQSNGTSAATNEGGGVFQWGLGGVSYGTGGTLSAISAIDGSYMANFRASVLSLAGPGVVQYSSGTALPVTAAFSVVAYDPFTAPAVAPSNWSVLGISAAGSLTGSVASVVGAVGGSVASVLGAVGGSVAGSVASVLGAVGGNVSGSVASVLNASVSVISINGVTITGSGTTADPFRPV